MRDLPIRRLGVDDLPGCLLLAEDRGWSREEHKWRVIFGTGVVYGVDDPDGGLAATVAATSYGGAVTAIGMMLVARRHERRGLGARLMRHAMDHAGTEGTWLTATEFGRPLYERLGFRAIGRLSSYQGTLKALPGDPSRPVSRPMDASDLPAVIALDAEVFGVPRAGLVTLLSSFSTSMRVVEGPSGITAYGATWQTRGAVGEPLTVVGPLVAGDGETAVALLADLAAGVEGAVRIDVEHRWAGLVGWVEEHGLGTAFSTTVMIHGADLPGDRDRLFLPFSITHG
ncbi:acetyltransferase [Planotetraspora thailandica]|uniref:Acetyltransferase n=1 Tax=Planotetraspora thailandica TaxID=487172 RepID=A0A8J4DEB4_9ACTN|nr:acetyltransferase [Planotetraspora thailandica]